MLVVLDLVARTAAAAKVVVWAAQMVDWHGREAQNTGEAQIGDQDVRRGPPVSIAPSRPHLYVFLN